MSSVVEVAHAIYAAQNIALHVNEYSPSTGYPSFHGVSIQQVIIAMAKNISNC